jgi:guanylate kinase
MGSPKKPIKGSIVVITGPPAVGKDTLVEELIKYKFFKFERIVSYNTRTPRAGELHGIHHFFVSEEEFQILRKGGKLLEHVRTGSSRKGTPKKPFFKALKGSGNFLWRIDPYRSVQLHKFYKKKFGSINGEILYKKTVVFYLTVDNIETLKNRWMIREEDKNWKDFEKRLKKDLKIFEKNKRRFHYVIPNEETKEKVTQRIIKLLENHFEKKST